MNSTRAMMARMTRIVQSISAPLLQQRAKRDQGEYADLDDDEPALRFRHLRNLLIDDAAEHGDLSARFVDREYAEREPVRADNRPCGPWFTLRAWWPDRPRITSGAGGTLGTSRTDRTRLTRCAGFARGPRFAGFALWTRWTDRTRRPCRTDRTNRPRVASSPCITHRATFAYRTWLALWTRVAGRSTLTRNAGDALIAFRAAFTAWPRFTLSSKQCRIFAGCPQDLFGGRYRRFWVLLLCLVDPGGEGVDRVLEVIEPFTLRQIVP
jgi:hypothetical protein